jgi:hypothetical protein
VKDPQIRALLQRTELAQYANDPHSRIVHEMQLPVAGARVDVAIINGHLRGYEIKGASDTLKRLPNQLKAYSLVFDYITVVTEAKYQEKILAIVPEWVGVSLCSDDSAAELVEVQKGKPNQQRDAFFIAKLLFKEELMLVLEEHGIRFRKSDRAWTLCEILANNLHIDELAQSVRGELKKRIAWS